MTKKASLDGHRIVFRHKATTVDVFGRDDGWYATVQGGEAIGPFDTGGKAVEAGIAGAETHRVQKNEQKRPKHKKSNQRKKKARIDNKYLRL